ncbi:hypothetical protein JMJ77_0012372 [Colletotrichum scovillei]|uniref:Uncharacterized protein n=1 Tax=Colletotrichum scovillei TaxID=1209932 RepID=A0A9P7QWY3_9PEZI|nr:hypothetical protein JMJ78_0001425 [Colletotrichum scovillei]KAG7041856.1 hypothetical protein JMJ77_0012372 [Colletotrichum scovillei]KAG7061886.1 hypothetical protein JMJ76_0003840 [Colletotrichum scovillei]
MYRVGTLPWHRQLELQSFGTQLTSAPPPHLVVQNSAKKPQTSALRPADDDAQTGLKALRALPSISTNPMGLLSRPPHIFIPSSLLVGPRPSFHQATPRGWFLVPLGHCLSLSLSITPWCSWLRYSTLSEAASPVTTAPITSG